MNKNTITKFLVIYNQENELEILKKEVSEYAPINRVLDRVGFFNYELFMLNNHKYIINYETEETYKFKSKLLITSVNPTEGGFIDMSEDDLDSTYAIIEKFMGIKI